MSGTTGEHDGVRVMSIPPGEVLDLRAALDLGGGIHRSDLWTGFATSAILPDPAWVEANAGSFDVAHLHLGVAAMSAVTLFHLMVRLRVCGKPVVLTVHNLEHPCLAQSALDELLRIAVPTADEIVTFTVGAARAILARWGRTAHILPHPPVIPQELVRRPVSHHRGVVVGLDLTRRCGVAEAWETVESAVRAFAGLDGTTLRVDIHPAIVTPGTSSYCPALAGSALDLHARGVLDLRIHEPLGLDELATYLQDLDAFVLPQRRGDHSSWVEACHDVGTPAIVPDHGWFAEQRLCFPYRASEADSLAMALRAALDSRESLRPRPGERAADVELIALAHRELYLALIEMPRRASPPTRVLQTQEPR